MGSSRKPAEGERAAIGGYHAQYLLAADLILLRLDEGRLEWVRLADPEAGRLDDFQVATPNRVDAYQFKWGAHPENFTYSDLSREKKAAEGEKVKQPPLITQIADGWQTLRQNHIGRRVVVHLTTNDIPSNSAAALLPLGAIQPPRKTFAAFIAEGWNAARQGECPPEWRTTLDSLFEVAGLQTQDRSEFLRSCELEFGRTLPTQSSDTRASLYRWQNLQLLVAYLMRTVAVGRVVQLTAEELLEGLGWANRYAYRARHEFPDPSGPYLPIAITSHDLEDRLTQLTGGYLSLVGPPGSGKSTLLTRTLRRPRPERVIRYYAYVPDAQDPAISRGESVNFFHDMCLALQHAGVSAEGTYLPAERELLLERFHRQLTLLGAEYRETGKKTILLLDGLDHIDRELNPVRSLLADLPRPEQVPAGVLFVLGSQTDQLEDLPEAVRHVLDRDGRRIQIGRLSREAVWELIRGSNLANELSPSKLEGAFIASDGHPLALSYLVEALRYASDVNTVDEILASAEPYRGDVEAQYQAYFRGVINDDELLPLLAAVARLRGAVDLDLLTQWFGANPVRRFAETFRRYFVVEANGRWRFFHNSFRLFLGTFTARGWSGSFDSKLDREAHRVLAERLGSESSDSPMRWEELYHRVSASDHESVCRLANQDYFRGQILALRPLGAVETDIEIAFPSTAACDDLRAYAALALSAAEVAQRRVILSDFDLPHYLLGIDQVARAVDAARDGNRLRIGAIEAFEFAVQLELRGEGAEARRVFELAEPLDILAGRGNESNPGHAWKVLKSWASSAPYFLPAQQIIERIKAAPPPHRFHEEVESPVPLHCHLLAEMGRTFAFLGRWQEFELALVAMPDGPEAIEARFELLLKAAYQSVSKSNRSIEFLERLEATVEVEGLTQSQRVRLAEAFLDFRADNTAAQKLLVDLQLPYPDWKRLEYSDDAFGTFSPMIRHARVLFRLGETRELKELVPDLVDHNDLGVVWFLRDLVIVGRIWARARMGQWLSTWDIKQEVSGIMQRFSNQPERGEGWHVWSTCRRSRGSFYQALIRATAEHGTDTLLALRNLFDRLWTDQAVYAWPLPLRREVACTFAKLDPIHIDWASSHLREIERSGFGDELQEQVQEGQAQIKAWLTLGIATDARRILDRTIQAANGIHGEDHQLSYWFRWLDRVASTDSDSFSTDLDWFARALVIHRRNTDGGASTAAAIRLVAIAGKLDPGKALELSKWLQYQGVFDHVDRVKAFLTAVLHRPELPARLAVYSLADLVVPFDSQGDRDLAASVIVAVHRQLGLQTAEWAADYLIRRISTFALPRTRRGWMSGIYRAAEQIGLNYSPALDTSETSEESSSDSGFGDQRPTSVLVLVDDTEVTLDEVLSHTHDISAVVSYAAREQYSSNFDWRPVIARLAERHQLEKLCVLARHFRNKRQVCVHLVALSERERLASPARAFQLASLAVDATDSYMWSSRYGEGTRFVATASLIASNLEVGRAKLWELLVHDRPRDPTTLEEASGQLRDEFPLSTMWPEVRNHLRAMFSPQLLSNDAPPDPNLSRHSAPLDQAFATLLVGFINHPVAQLTSAARRACAASIIEGEVALLQCVRDRLRAREADLQALLEILDAASAVDSQIVTAMRADLQPLIDVPDAAVAVFATDLVSRAGGPSMQPTPRPLPQQYQVIVPENATQRFRIPGFPEPGQPWPDTDDPRQLFAAVAEVYDFLAEQSGIRVVDLLHRGARFMYEIVPHEVWGADGERRLYQQLETARLQYTYRTPRSDVVFRATFRLTAELWQASEIEEGDARLVVEHLRQCDPTLALCEPLPRPIELPQLAFDDRTDHDVELWLEKGESSLSLLLERLADGRKVVAEASTLEVLGNGTRTEDRFSVLCPASRTKLPLKELSLSVSRRSVKRYAKGDTKWDHAALVIHHEAGATYENPAAEWLAFNPVLAERIGWQLSHEGLFRWVDDEGRTMVESLWWQDGPKGFRAHLANDCVAEGWLVVASDDAFRALPSTDRELQRVRHISRTGPAEGSTKSESDFRDEVTVLR